MSSRAHRTQVTTLLPRREAICKHYNIHFSFFSFAKYHTTSGPWKTVSVATELDLLISFLSTLRNTRPKSKGCMTWNWHIWQVSIYRGDRGRKTWEKGRGSDHFPLEHVWNNFKQLHKGSCQKPVTVTGKNQQSEFLWLWSNYNE